MDEKKDAEPIHGVIIPAFTPLEDDERVDEEAYRLVLRRCLNEGVDGILAGGSAGLGTSPSSLIARLRFLGSAEGIADMSALE